MRSMAIPLNAQSIWNALWQELAGLHGRWIIYRQLVGVNEKRVNLLKGLQSDL
jgi:hypothetical protein